MRHLRCAPLPCELPVRFVLRATARRPGDKRGASTLSGGATAAVGPRRLRNAPARTASSRAHFDAGGRCALRTTAL